MRFSVLGPLEVREGPTVLPLGGPRQRSVLALLLLASGRVLDPDALAIEIWGDEPPDGARDSLYTYVSNLRRSLGRARIVRADGGYRLHQVDDDVVDVVEFEAGLLEARRLAGSDPEAAVSLIEASLASWRGRPYEGFEDLPSAMPEAARIEELRLRGLEDRIQAELRTGRVPDVGGVEMLTGEHPYRERLWELLARSLYRAGRQAEALGALSRLRRILADDLGIDVSPSISRLEEQILVHDPALELDSRPSTNLPAAVSSFIGRTSEVADLERVVHGHRLVTVTGPGGAGKTRLALEVARRVAGTFPDGAWLADLARVADAEGVAETVTAVFRPVRRPSTSLVDTLAGHLRSRTVLLVLDNCEHVAEAVGPLATRLLSDAPGLRILATSRRPLAGTGETLFPLAGLGTTTDDGAGDAERLFEERAAAVRPGFGRDEASRSDVTSICRHLDGLPLAIELAAARVDVLSPREIDGYLADRFRLLDSPREDRPGHRSLAAAFDWSYELLDPAGRAAFDCLGVFDGPFSVAASTAVLGVTSELGAVDDLGRLVGASLLQAMPGTPSRYRLLETLRLYARTHLEAANRWRELAESHDQHFRDRCRDLRGAFFGSGRTDARTMVESELHEYEAAFDRFVEDGRVEAALEMAWPLGHVWLFSGMIDDGAERLARLLAATGGTAGRARADALTISAFLVSFAQRYEQAIAWSEEAIDIYRAIGDGRGLAYALARSGHFAFSIGDAKRAIAQLEESIAVCERIGYEEGAAWPLTLIGQARLWSGDESDDVRAMLEEGRRRFIAIGDPFGQVHANMFIPNVGNQGIDVQLRYANESMELVDRPGADPLFRPVAFHNLAFSVWNAGDRERAVALNRVAARSALEMGATVTSGMALLQAGLFAGVAGGPERAAVLYGAGDRSFVMRKPPFYVRQLQPGVDAAVAALGAARYEQLHAQGSAMRVEEATAFLLRD